MIVQWYPGHMTKTRRQMEADLKYVDLVAEIVDARIPISSRNPDIEELCAGKPRVVLLNRADQASPEGNRRWSAYYRERGLVSLETDARSGRGTQAFPAAARAVLGDQIARWKEKGMTGRTLRAMVVGVPNVGKSTLINKLSGRKSAKASDRPGVTRGKQWVRVDRELELLDTPGILWPRFEDERIGMYLAFTGAVRDEVMDTETLGCELMALLARRSPQTLLQGYKLERLEEREPEENPVAYGYRLLMQCAQKRGMRISGGELDTQRMANVLLDEYRGGKLGRLTLEWPEDLDGT